MLARFGTVYLPPAKSNNAEECKQNKKYQITDNFSENLEAIENFLMEHSCN